MAVQTRTIRRPARTTQPYARARTRRHRTRAAILLEILLALGLLVFGLGVVGLRVNAAMQIAERDQQWTTAMLLTETVMSKVQGGDIDFNETDDRLKGHFKIYYPGYSWRIKVRPCEIEDIFLLTLEIGFNPAHREAQIQSPERDIDFEDAGTTTIRTAYRLVPRPADINLTRDMGIDPEMLQLDEALTGGSGDGEGAGGGGGGGDAMSALIAMIRDFITKHPELLTPDGGIDLNAIRNLDAAELAQVMPIIKAFMGDPSGFESMLGELREQFASEHAQGEDRPNDADMQPGGEPPQGGLERPGRNEGPSQGPNDGPGGGQRNFGRDRGRGNANDQRNAGDGRGDRGDYEDRGNRDDGSGRRRTGGNR